MVNFKTVRYKNFLSSGNIFTEVYLDKHQMTLVIGENGCGKSTMLDAITFALFGKSYRNINKPQLVNSINGKDMVVEIEFTVSNKEYKVVRGIKPAIFEIYCEGQLINQDASSKDYQEHLEKNILKFNFKSFTQIVILGSSSFVPFMLLSAGERRVIIEDLLDIQIFSAMNTVVKEKMSIIKNETAEIKRDMENTMSQIELQKKYVAEAKKNTKQQLEKKEKELNSTVASIDDHENRERLIQKHVDVLLNKISNESKIRKNKTMLDKYEAKIENNIQKLETNIKFFNDNSTCPTCDQTLANKEIKIQESAIKIKEYNDGILKLKEEQSSVDNLLNFIVETQRKISDHQSELKGIKATITQLKSYKDKIEKEIEELKNKKAISEEMLNVSQSLVNKLEELEEKRKNLIVSKQYTEVASTLLKDNGIKAKIIKQYLPIINKLVNKYLSSMNFFVNFEINEEFKENIKSRHRDDFSYQNFSEGERMRIDLSLLLTWRAVSKIKNSMNTNLLILDEVFDSSLDSNGTEEFMKLLNTLGNNSNVFVISHKGDVLVDKFSHILRFEKHKNFSQLKV